MRKQVVLAGKTNAGKSTVFNLLLGQDVSIVSEVSGTTTDPVVKAMELIPYGPIALVDTAGLLDDSPLGLQRMEKTEEFLRRADLVLRLVAATEEEVETPKEKHHLLVFTKSEGLSKEALEKKKAEYPHAVFLSNYGREGLDELKKKMIEVLQATEEEEKPLIGDLLPSGSVVVLVTPIDSAAPKGRLILPQVQVLRDCLDHDMKAVVTKETTLKETLQDLRRVDLVVTDSQVFDLVDQEVPPEIPMTSFSMLLARQKGNFRQYLDGAEKLFALKDGSKVLVLEGCTHNSTHEDIGRVKLPRMIEKKIGARCEYTYYSGYQFPKETDQFDLALSCGMCMVHEKEVCRRLKILEEKGIPVVNYGVAMAALQGILGRAGEIFRNSKK